MVTLARATIADATRPGGLRGTDGSSRSKRPSHTFAIPSPSQLRSAARRRCGIAILATQSGKIFKTIKAPNF